MTGDLDTIPDPGCWPTSRYLSDGFVYYVGATSGGEFHSVEEAMRWADAQPWGPVNWGER
jgi:hypothetical protein